MYAGQFGIETALALIDQPVDDHVRAQLARLQRSGAALHFTRTKARTFAVAPWLMVRHMKGGRLPYYLPPGGSSPIGALGYVEAALELAAQVDAGEIPEPAHIVAPVGSGGTVAGLLLGLRLAGLRTGVVAVVVNDTLPLGQREIRDLADAPNRYCGNAVPTSATSTCVRRRDRDARIPRPRYGYATAEGRAAQRVGHEFGIPLDPVYTAKAFAGLLEIDAHTRGGDGPIVMLDTFGPRPD